MTSFDTTQLRQYMLQGAMPATIVGWNRLEGRPRSDSFERSLKAEVRDPYWLLARQYQVGEFAAEDCGSPAKAAIQTRTAPIDRYQPHKGAGDGYDHTVPLESRVEMVDPPATLGDAVMSGRWFLRFLSDQGLGAYRDRYRARYRVRLPAEDDSAVETYAHADVLGFTKLAASRALNGTDLFAHLDGGGDATDGIALDAPEDADPLRNAASTYADWYRARLVVLPEGERCWRPEQLEYSFACSARTADGRVALDADAYTGGRLDWYAFDAGDVDAGDADAAAETVATTEFIPAPLTFRGMPALRWWEFEDNRLDFGAIDAHTTDIARLLMAEFGLVYANDWFLMPFAVDVAQVASVSGLVVTDVFGDRYWVDPAGAADDRRWERWSMYGLGGADVDATRWLVLPNTVEGSIEGAPSESVALARDEMANMVWGVELRVTLGDGAAHDGRQTARETLEYLTKRAGETAAATPSTSAEIRYVAESTVPEHWVPFIPVHVDGSSRQTQLQRGAMQRTLDGVTTPVGPRTSILTAPDAGATYLLHEDAVLRSGRQVTGSFQRARWTNGAIISWFGRSTTIGRGEGRSGLAFDQVLAVRKAPE